MESPTLWFTLLLFPLGRCSSNPKSLFLISPFIIHYFHRTVLYPLRLRKNPLTATRLASHSSPLSTTSSTPTCRPNGCPNTQITIRITGFGGGFVEGGAGYKIPGGGLFEYVSCANYRCRRTHSTSVRNPNPQISISHKFTYIHTRCMVVGDDGADGGGAAVDLRLIFLQLWG
ncbi:putative 3-oxo-5-alpha-steroid 4-dehydrogenase (NADP(+)) [Helianthus anomalus]